MTTFSANSTSALIQFDLIFGQCSVFQAKLSDFSIPLGRSVAPTHPFDGINTIKIIFNAFSLHILRLIRILVEPKITPNFKGLFWYLTLVKT